MLEAVLFEGAESGVLGRDEVQEAADALDPGTAAAVLLYENVWALPFAGVLLSIALGPILAPHVWHAHYGKIGAGWAILLIAPLLWTYGDATFLPHGSARDMANRLKEMGVLVAVLGKNVIRAATHLDVSHEQCRRAAEAIRGLK